ncbi:ML domain-containing protein [Streptomyces sp. NPDC048483]|uniref:ML domain-containing protein n=1 Tax=Streptomyces sp. NPDC048483 TaxID=3154927 RepID=UPI00342ABC8D
MTNWSYANCGLPDDALVIESITSTPDSMKPASEWKATIKAVAQTEIKDGAYLDVTVRLGLVKLLHKQFDMFEMLRGYDAAGWTLTRDTGGGDETIKEGPVTLTLAKKLEKETPRAKFTVNVRGFTVEEEDMVCLDFKVDFMQG